MARTFKKGDAVYRFANWDSKGTVWFRRYTVGSWGKRNGHLIHLDGTNRLTRVYTEYVTDALTSRLDSTYRLVSEVADPAALAIELAGPLLASIRADYLRCLTQLAAPSYYDIIRADLAQLHEPRAYDGDAHGVRL